MAYAPMLAQFHSGLQTLRELSDWPMRAPPDNNLKIAATSSGA
jgi:hypothetical protein